MNSTRRLSASLALAVAAILAAAPASSETFVAVKGDRVNLRAAPAAEAEVVGQVSAPDRLVLQGSLADPWVKVTPPASLDLWIFAALVTDGKVNVNKAQVRAGAGLNYHAVGQLEQGDAVDVRGQVGDWLKIAPFPAAAVWVTNSYVEACAPPSAPPPPAPAAAAQPAPAPEPPPPAPEPPAPVNPLVLTAPTPADQSPAPPPPLDDAIVPAAADPVAPRAAAAASRPDAAHARPAARPPRRSIFGDPDDKTAVGPAKVPASRLRGNAEQAVSGAYSGILALAPTGAHPTRFRLVVFTVSGQPQTVCYVLGNSRQLDSLKGATFTIEGAVYWFKDTDLPTVFAQNILRHQGR